MYCFVAYMEDFVREYFADDMALHRYCTGYSTKVIAHRRTHSAGRNQEKIKN